jgi:membrane dipeptidase
VNFSPTFVADDGEADVSAVADHIEHIARVAGKKHVGIGSDFDGIESVPKGLEDVSKYPALVYFSLSCQNQRR